MVRADQASRLSARIFSNDRCDRHSGVLFSHFKMLYSKMKRLFSCNWQKRYMNNLVSKWSNQLLAGMNIVILIHRYAFAVSCKTVLHRFLMHDWRWLWMNLVE